MKRNLFKKLAAAAGAAVMALTLVMPMGVSAAPINDYPAPEAKGSLTITKYESTTGAGEWNTSDGVQSPPSEGATPLGGVTFTILKVGTVSQETYTVDGKQVTGLVYDITDTELRSKLSSLTDDDKAEPVTSGTNKYTSTVLDKALKALYESDQNVADGIVTREDVRDDAESQTTLEAGSGDLQKGQAKFAELDQGLYLVAETAAPAEVTTKSVPFFVSIPSVVNGENGNTQWTLDVSAYPKNSTGNTSIDKIISDVTDAADQSESNDINTVNKDKAEATIGDTITYQVPVTAVVPADGLTKLNLADTMDKGLTLVKSDGTAIKPALTASETPITDVVEVYEGKNTTGTKLTEGTDYTVTAKKNDNGSTSLTVAFKGTKLSALNTAADKTPQFTFVYKAKLNADAVIGQTGNKNSVKLIYNYNNGPSQDVESKPQETIVYTWGIDILKQGEDSQNLNGVEFELYNGSVADGNKMKFRESDGVYTPATDGSTTLVTANEGKLQIRGLEAGTYILKEIKTNQGYVLLKDTITIKITDTDIAGLASATVANGTSSATSVTMKEDNGSAQALVPLTVVNNKGFDLPQTGAAGTAIFAIAGIVLVAVAGALLIFRRKTQK